MSFPLTLDSVKDLTNMLEDFETRSYITPLEYVQSALAVLQESMAEKQVTWIVESFLGINKHLVFFEDIINRIMESPTPLESKHFIIIFYSIINTIQPESSRILYKVIFLLNKKILKKLVDNLSNNEFLIFVSELASNYLEPAYITEKIIAPLFAWQPYIAEMGHEYDLFLKKIERKGIKQPTVPQPQNVLNRSILKKNQLPPKMPSPTSSNRKCIKYSPPKKNVIEDKMKFIRALNRQKAELLFKEAQENLFSCAKTKQPDKNKTTGYIKSTKEETSKPGHSRRAMKFNKKYDVKSNTTSIIRLKHRLDTIEKEELNWIHNILNCCQDTDRIRRIEDEAREYEQRKQELLIEKKHLKGLISFEDAVLAKHRAVDENKKKHEHFHQEKVLWDRNLEEWKKMETEKIKKIMEKASLSELRLLTAKKNSQDKKKDIARNVKEETEFLLGKFLEEKHLEIQRKAALIKEMKTISSLTKDNNLVKSFDFTSNSKFGFLCEMSTAELENKLTTMKKEIQDKINQKRQSIISQKQEKKEKLLSNELEIKQYFDEKLSLKETTICKAMSAKFVDDDELLEMKKTLETKRKERMAMVISNNSI